MNGAVLARLRSCEIKHDYPAERVALHVARLLRQRTGENINAYRCRFCGGWHIGHKRGLR